MGEVSKHLQQQKDENCTNRTKYNSLLSTPILLCLFCVHGMIHDLLYQSHCPHEAYDFYHVTKKKKRVEKIQQKDCHNCYRH